MVAVAIQIAVASYSSTKRYERGSPSRTAGKRVHDVELAAVSLPTHVPHFVQQCNSA